MQNHTYYELDAYCNHAITAVINDIKVITFKVVSNESTRPRLVGFYWGLDVGAIRTMEPIHDQV